MTQTTSPTATPESHTFHTMADAFIACPKGTKVDEHGNLRLPDGNTVKLWVAMELEVVDDDEDGHRELSHEDAAGMGVYLDATGRTTISCPQMFD